MNAEEILGQINAFRRAREGYVSNLFATRTQLQELLAQGTTTVHTGEGLIVILQEESELIRLNYIAKSKEALHSMHKILPKTDKQIVTDVLGKEPQASAERDLLCECGFRLYSTFFRMTASELHMPSSKGVENVIPAGEEDVQEVYDMIRGEFDPLFAHIPTVEELKDNIQKGDVLLVKKSGQIAGIAFFEHTSDRYIVLRYFIVAEQFRGQNIGGALLAYEFLKKTERTLYMLWVGSYNKTQYLYEKLGFSHDGLNNYILLYEQEGEQYAAGG